MGRLGREKVWQIYTAEWIKGFSTYSSDATGKMWKALSVLVQCRECCAGKHCTKGVGYENLEWYAGRSGEEAKGFYETFKFSVAARSFETGTITTRKNMNVPERNCSKWPRSSARHVPRHDME